MHWLKAYDVCISRAIQLSSFVGLWICFLHRKRLDSIVYSGWTQVKETTSFQHDSFEPALVAFSFAAWHLLFFLTDSFLFTTLKPWRIQQSDDRRHWKYEKSNSRWQGELLAVLGVYFAPILLFDHFCPRRNLPASAPTSMQLGMEVLASLAVYDALFFACHLACHKVPLLYRSVHAKHHTKTVQRVSETLRLSPLEVAIDTMCSVVALNTVKAHPLSRAVYNLLITYLICELHSGYNFPWMMQNILPGFWAGSVRHDWHHQHGGRRFYQKLFTYLDDMYEYLTEEGKQR